MITQAAFCQHHLQHAQRVVDTGLDRADRDPQGLGRLVSRPVPEDRLVEYLPVRRRQLEHRVGDRDPQYGGRRVIVNGHVRGRARFDFRRSRSFPAMLVDHDTPCHRGQPGH
jgi:hypothetical protein